MSAAALRHFVHLGDGQVYPEGNQSNNNQFLASATGTISAIDGLKVCAMTQSCSILFHLKSKWSGRRPENGADPQMDILIGTIILFRWNWMELDGIGGTHPIIRHMFLHSFLSTSPRKTREARSLGPRAHFRSDWGWFPVSRSTAPWVNVYRKWPFIVDFPMKNGDFPWFSIVMLVYQGLSGFTLWLWLT